MSTSRHAALVLLASSWEVGEDALIKCISAECIEVFYVGHDRAYEVSRSYVIEVG